MSGKMRLMRRHRYRLQTTLHVNRGFLHLRGALFLLLKIAVFCTLSSVHQLTLPTVHDDLSILV